MNFIRSCNQISLKDIALVGGKGASLGQLIQKLAQQGINIPQGFVITTEAYDYFLSENGLTEKIKSLVVDLDTTNLEQLEIVSQQIRDMIIFAEVPTALWADICDHYGYLEHYYRTDKFDTLRRCIDVAVRSSATAEDLPEASFAGQQDSYLNITGVDAVLLAYKKCVASLFNARAISYRAYHKFSFSEVKLAVVIQKMVRSDGATSGVMFTVDTETGFDGVVYLTGSYGLGEMVVQGAVNPDEFYVHKATVAQGYKSILKKRKGSKQIKMVYADQVAESTKIVEVELQDQRRFCLQDDEILILAQQAMLIEQTYAQEYGRVVPVDIEWAKDAYDGKLYIVQVRPETIHSLKKTGAVVTEYHFAPDALKNRKIVAVGKSVSKSVIVGRARVVTSAKEMHVIEPGQIIVTDMTDPDWEPVMKKSAGIVTNRGGRTCHAAIVSRELGIAAIVGTGTGTEKIQDGDLITLDTKSSDQGVVYQGVLEFTKQEIVIENLPAPKTSLMLNLANPDQAFELTKIPNTGVGLLRLEFIINNSIKVHPMALVDFEKVTDIKDRQLIEGLTLDFTTKQDFFVTTLAQEVATIAAAFFPKPVIVRLSDFKSNEYANLLGGRYFERTEENPMLGFRGASRYYHDEYRHAFALECAALKRVRELMGFKNVIIMVPFVRTVAEAELVVAEMARHGLVRGKEGLELYMMCEVPSNVLLIEKFAVHFDGFSIGSNDLMQTTLAVDRDSGVLTQFDERDEAVQLMLKMAIEGAHHADKKIGICGQAPSDFPELARYLQELKIDSISLTPDSVIKTILALKT